MSVQILSIRSALIGSVSDLVHEAGFKGIETNIVVDLVYHLSEYREEESPLFPDVYLIDESDNIDILRVIAPGMERISIGNRPSNDAVEFALKDCAALATNGWSIFLRVVHTGIIEYGLFRAFELPFSFSADESLCSTDSETVPALLIRNCSSRCVELISSSGKRIELSLTSAQPANASVSTQIARLANLVVSDVEESERNLFRAYIQRLLNDICRKSHGTLIAVVPSETSELPPELSDGVVLTSPINLFQAAEEMKSNQNSSSLSRLLALETLLKGMISSDGITILTTNCSVLAFRIFIKPTSNELAEIESPDIRGGARSRAFELLKHRVGSQIKGAFFRSQDGRTECVVKDE